MSQTFRTSIIGNILVVGLLMVSCAPKSQDQKFEDIKKEQIEFYPRVQDKEIFPYGFKNENFDISSLLSLESSSAKVPLLEGSSNLFLLSEHLMDLDAIPKDKQVSFAKWGHALMKAFYQTPGSVTTFDRSNVLYLTAALGQEGEKILNLFKEMSAPEVIQKINSVFECPDSVSEVTSQSRCHKIVWPQEQPELNPTEFIKSIRVYLHETSKMFSDLEINKNFIGNFNSQIENDYLSVLSLSEKEIASVSVDQPLFLNASSLVKAIEILEFLPKGIRDQMVSELTKAKNYGQNISSDFGISDGQIERQVKVLVSIWLDLNENQRKTYILSANQKLYEALSDYSSNQPLMEYLAGRGEKSWYNSLYWKKVQGGFESALQVSCHPEIKILLEQWLSWSHEKRFAYQSENPQLFSIFSHYSIREIKDKILKYYVDNKFSDGDISGQFVKELTPVCASDVENLLSRSINKYVLAGLDAKIRQWGPLIETMVHDKTTSRLEEIAQNIQTKEKFEDYFRKIADKEMDKILFKNGVERVDAIENSSVNLMYDTKDKLLRLSSPPRTTFKTGAMVLGTSLSAQMKRILQYREVESPEGLGDDYLVLVFSQINKMIDMIGFQDFESRLNPSLHRRFVGDHPDLDAMKFDCNPSKLADQELRRSRYPTTHDPNDFVDPREYCGGFETAYKDIFLIPDELAIEETYKPKDGVFPIYASARAQAEIIRGASLMLQYFQDWKKNDFDETLGRKKYGDISVFPKEAFVNVTIGLSTLPLRVFKKEGSSLRLYNAKGSEILDWRKNGIDFNGGLESRIVEAIVTDLTLNGPDSTVRLTDLTAYIEAIVEFLKATEGIEKSKANAISPEGKTIKDNLNMIIEGRRLLKLLVFGMSNFIVSHFQDDTDGGFWGEYSLESKMLVKPQSGKSLTDQTSAIMALNQVYKMWRSQGALISATEGYYFMNQDLWNESKGFYEPQQFLELDKSGRAIENRMSLLEYVETLIAVHKMSTELMDEKSRSQAERIFDFGIEKLKGLDGIFEFTNN